MQVSLKYVGGNFKNINNKKLVSIAKFTDGKIAFNTRFVDKYAEEYNYKMYNYENEILEIITDEGNARFEANEKEYKKFVKMMSEKATTRVKHPYIILIVVFICISAFIYYCAKTDNSGNIANIVSIKKTTNPNVTKAVEAPTFENGTINNATIKTALSKVDGTNVLDINSKDFKNIDIEDANGKVITIVFKPQVEDETDLAQKAANTMVKYCEVLSKNKNISCVFIELDTDFVDQYGKSSEGQAVWIKYSRDTLNKIDYKNFEDMVYGDYTKAYQVADNYKIATGIYDELKDLNGLPGSK